MDNNELKALGIVFRDTDLLAAAYAKHKLQLILPIYGAGATLALDLNALPTKPFNFKEVFLKWALQANESRLAAGKEPVFPMGLIQACPLWKLVPAPFVSLDLTKEGLLKQTGRTQPVIGKASGGALKRSTRNIR